MATEEGKFCVYCGQTKPISKFSDEHVIPSALSGPLKDNPFVLKDVCERCNNVFGSYVDGPFIKSWLTHNGKAEAVRSSGLYGGKSLFPLYYFGQIKEFSYGNHICDFWLGPTGDSIYHFHEPYPEESDIGFSAGRSASSYKCDWDDGFVFLFIVATNPAWHLPIIGSVFYQFRKRKDSKTVLYLGNGPTPSGGLFSEIPLELKELHETLRPNAGKPIGTDVTMDFRQGERFLAKLALGLGALFLDPSFVTSTSADNLRAYAREKDWEKRAKIQLRQTGFRTQLPPEVTRMFDWPRGPFLEFVPGGQ